MKSFFSPGLTRLVATVLLFVWLMTLGVGIANACLVHQDEGGHGYSASIFATVTDHQGADERNTLPETLACWNFCATKRSTLVKVKQPLVNSVGIDFVPVLFFTGLLAPTIDRDIQPEALSSPTWSEPPVFIRFSRLTI